MNIGRRPEEAAGKKAEKAAEKAAEKKAKWETAKKKQVLCVAVGILLGAAGFAWQHGGASVCTYLEREDYGGDPVVYDLSVEGLEQEVVPLQIEISPRRYTEKEAAEVFAKIKTGLLEEILGENQSLQEVKSDLILPTEKSGGIRIAWRSNEPEILDDEGTVLVGEEKSGSGKAGGIQVTLQAELTDGFYRDELEVAVTVYPPEKSKAEQLAGQLARQVEQAASEQPGAVRVALPEDFEGRQLRFRKETGTEYLLFPVLGVILAVFFHWQARNTEIEAHKKREKQLQYDYADLVYQLMVFTGAGLTVSRAWKQIVNNYEKRLEHENSQQRAVYEEMEIALGEMENGLPESQAVSRFGERCQHNEYRRLSSILGQSRQTGMKNLQELLAQEMDTAWEQQKQAAKRLGEEAGTKLLLPLFLMLLVVMVLVMVPALMVML